MENMKEEILRLKSYCESVLTAVRAYIAGEPLSENNTYIERLLLEHREKEQTARSTVFATSNKKMPPLTVSYGSSGLEIRALLDESFNCVEYTTRQNMPQQVLIAPWIQFEPAELANERLRIVMEIARRAMAHDDMVKRVSQMEKLVEEWRDVEDKSQEERQKIVEAWRKERVAAGKPADFSDIEEL